MSRRMQVERLDAIEIAYLGGRVRELTAAMVQLSRDLESVGYALAEADAQMMETCANRIKSYSAIARHWAV